MNNLIQLNTVLEDLHNISGFRISIYDTGLKEIAAYPKSLSGFCALIQENKCCRDFCVKNDREAFRIVQESKEIYFYRCKFGLYEAVAPIYHFGVLSGYLMMGQTIDDLQDSKSYIYQESIKYLKDTSKLCNEIEKLPTSSKNKILSCISIMNICARYITLNNHLNLTDKNLAHKIKKYINENFHKKISISFLCEIFFCSRSTLFNTFKKTYNETINEYLTKVRLENSLKLLKNQDYSINYIANNCGFSDQNYFSKVFSKTYSMSPSEYRNKNAKE
ncbi:PocR ligand-binding domain-containing protein [Clostridium sp.]|uniref:PocR ligand-binding domain-containing protein n=1 Tax=Clostridium sp. TaxID=1506 RepID=UPI0034644555